MKKLMLLTLLLVLLSATSALADTATYRNMTVDTSSTYVNLGSTIVSD